MTAKDSYQKLIEKYREQKVLYHISGLVSWDFETNMPPKGGNQRGEMMGFLSKLSHQMQTDPSIAELLNNAENKDLDEDERRNLYLIRRDYDKNTKIPMELVIERSKLSTEGTQIWKKARKENDWKSFEPIIEKFVVLMRKIAHALNPDEQPYNVLLDFFEPGMTMEKYDKIFTELRDGTIDLLNRIKQAEQGNRELISQYVSQTSQEKLMHELIPVLGYDMEGGRLDVAAHPFTGGPGYDDVRITTRYDENDFASSFFGVAHEAGHGIYEQNVAPEHRYQPIGNSCSMGVHESQSRFYENVICRSPKFWKYFMPKLLETTGDTFVGIDFDDFMKAINIVTPSKIRVEADEVTYNLHIILRYEIERDLISGKISVSDLPQVWNEKMMEYLGIDPETDSDGVMQDIHWSGGAFGYFPTYSLGNLYGAQFLHQMEKDIPEWENKMLDGELEPVHTWLREKIHYLGNRYDPIDLVKNVTGEDLNPEYLLDYLNKKYSDLYNLG